MMSAEDDARARREAWEAAGSPDYNVTNYQTAPTVTGSSVTGPGPAVAPGPAPWVPEPIADPNADPAHQPGGSIFETWKVNEPGQYAEWLKGSGRAQSTKNEFGQTRGQYQAEQIAQQQKTAEATAAAKQQETENKLAQEKFDFQKAQQDALNAYNTAMLAYQDRRLAQEAYDSSILAAYREHQLAVTAQQNTMAQRVAMKARTPFRSARLSYV